MVRDVGSKIGVRRVSREYKIGRGVQSWQRESLQRTDWSGHESEQRQGKSGAVDGIAEEEVGVMTAAEEAAAVLLYRFTPFMPRRISRGTLRPPV
jgi:hypothetical protein